ncbi:MAG: hypothetical protein HMLIMOIP_002566 [Candidatus Nitrosomirales archaeon]|jgi:hypothetical protein
MPNKGKELLFQLGEIDTTTASAREPSVKAGISISTVIGLIAIVQYFFPDIPESTLRYIIVVAAFLLPIISAFLIRRKVWSPASVQEAVDEAVKRATEEIRKQQRLTSLKNDPKRFPSSE